MKMKLVYENTAPIDEANIKLNLFAVFRDEEILLPYFIDYYQSLGVSHFYLIDNQSEDRGSEYLKSRKDINLHLFHTDDSYNKTMFGSTWVKQCMEQYCINEYCLRADIDELLLLHPSYSDVQALLEDMEQQASNALPAIMLDLYPEKLNNDYQAGSPFSSHSQYFDRIDNGYVKLRSKLYGSFYWLEGGARARLFGTSNILQKFPLIKNNFSQKGIILGPHFFYEGTKTIAQCPTIRLHQTHALLLHYKFLQPNFKDFLTKRLSFNQHWNNSEEYRKYLATLEAQSDLVFHHPDHSRLYQNANSPQGYWQIHKMIAHSLSSN